MATNSKLVVDGSRSYFRDCKQQYFFCRFTSFKKDIPKVAEGYIVNYILTNRKDKKPSGNLTRISNAFDCQNKSVVVHAVFNNASPLNLIAGK